ncbi:MAG: sigma-70 family RNA polymerase sigma factor [Candidatus Omnitrophica bacterium]|nr:sigma-70 family RNA polymerase sigma factor [Candidatus Omnitrophota bacterium]
MQDISRDLLMQASKGDMQAFEEIYRLASSFVYSVALRIISNADEAKEVTQDVFIKIYNNLRRFRFRSSFKTWVYRITANTALNALKKNSKEMSRRAADYDVALKAKDDRATTTQAIEMDDNKKLLSSLLDMLNPDQRACIVLREIEGLDYKEISRALGININTVRSRLKRAREALLAHGKRGDRP